MKVLEQGDVPDNLTSYIGHSSSVFYLEERETVTRFFDFQDIRELPRKIQ